MRNMQVNPFVNGIQTHRVNQQPAQPVQFNNPFNKPAPPWNALADNHSYISTDWDSDNPTVRLNAVI